MKIIEKHTPRIAKTFRDFVPSPSFFIVTRVAAEVKKYPMEAPMELISTNHPKASRPRIGPDKEIMMQKIIAFFGVLYFGSILPNHSGRKPSWLMEYIKREAEK